MELPVYSGAVAKWRLFGEGLTSSAVSTFCAKIDASLGTPVFVPTG